MMEEDHRDCSVISPALTSKSSIGPTCSQERKLTMILVACGALATFARLCIMTMNMNMTMTIDKAMAVLGDILCVDLPAR